MSNNNDLTKEQFLEVTALWADNTNACTWSFTRHPGGVGIVLSETALIEQFRRFDPVLADKAQKIRDIRLEMAAHINKSRG